MTCYPKYYGDEKEHRYKTVPGSVPETIVYHPAGVVTEQEITPYFIILSTIFAEEGLIKMVLEYGVILQDFGAAMTLLPSDDKFWGLPGQWQSNLAQAIARSSPLYKGSATASATASTSAAVGTAPQPLAAVAAAAAAADVERAAPKL